MTISDIHELAELCGVSVSTRMIEGYSISLGVFGERENRRRFIEVCEERKPFALMIYYVEGRFRLLHEIKDVLSFKRREVN